MLKTSSFTSIGVERLRIGIDGKGVTTLVAGYNCPLRCRWCLNPQCFDQNTKTKTYKVDTLLETVSIDNLYFQATEGGITFGGGEPLLQADFIHAFKERCPVNWKINIETSLNVGQDILLSVIEDIDTFIVDIKDMNPQIYQAYTGCSNQNVLRNLSYLLPIQEKVFIRVPHIPDFNTDKDVQRSIQSLREMGFQNIEEFTYSVKRSLRKQKK